MRSWTIYERFSKTFRDNRSLSILLAVFTVSSGGIVAYSVANSSNGANIIASSEAGNRKKRVVVLGTGWAGTSFLKNLKNPSYDVQVISPRNYFAFTPLLPSVSCGTVEARSIIEPIRNIVGKTNVNIHYWEAECFKIDAENKKVYCRSSQDTNLNGNEEFIVDYDYLVIAMGARANTFNTPGVEENCHFLKEVEDAQKIRRTIIDCFERASLPNLTDQERQRVLQFVVVGGGPTGVEFAAELHDYVSEDLVKKYPKVKDLVKITLLEAGDHILNMFDEGIRGCAEKKFRRDGIDLKTGSNVVSVSNSEIFTKKIKNGKISSIPYGMVVWSTGIGTRPVIMDFMKQIGQANRSVLATDEWLRVEKCDGVYALGDCATSNLFNFMGRNSEADWQRWVCGFVNSKCNSNNLSSLEGRNSEADWQRWVCGFVNCKCNSNNLSSLEEDISATFRKADKDNSGTLTVKEFKEALADISERFPEMQLYLKNKQIRSLVGLLKDSTELNIEEFKLAISQVDLQIKNLPATAQVAAQQGAYLANCFNKMEECEKIPEGQQCFGRFVSDFYR